MIAAGVVRWRAFVDLSSLRHILVELAVGVRFDYCEYVEIGDIFISDTAFCVNIFDPAPAGMVTAVRQY